MRHSRLASTALLLAALLPPAALADEHQGAISKAFPGFRILRPSDIKLDIANREFYNQVKDSPGLIVGNFNGDKLPDFAALIRGKRLIRIAEDKARGVWADQYYEGYLAVCLGRAQGGYECTKLKADPIRIREPHGGYLWRVSPPKAGCLELSKFKAPKPKRDFNVLEPKESNVDITFDTDAIAYYGSDSDYAIYVPQPRGLYLECGVGH